MSEKSAENTNRFHVSPNAPAKGGTPPPGPPEYEDLGELPSGYGEMFVVARDPHCLYSYWDFDYSQFPQSRKLLLQIFRGETLENVIEINEIARNWYIPVQAADADYRVCFGYRDANDNWTEVGSAGPTHTPPESISPKWETEFATVPFHLSFNFLVDVIEAAQAKHEPLTEALGRLQQTAVGAGGESSSWGIDQMRILEQLLGKNFLDRLFSMNSAEITEFFRTEFSEKLDSESASELLAKGRLALLLAPGETSSLFSGSFGEWLRQELSSAGVSSFALAQLGGISSEFLSSGAFSSAELAARGLSSAELAARGLSSAELAARGLSSAELAAGGLSSAELAAGGVSSAELAAGGLWSGALAAAGLSSGAFASELFPLGLASESFASWQSGIGGMSSYSLISGVSSWSGLEFGISSWNELISESSLFSGFGASWSAQPFGGIERGFFMHVNAEVIFYGGTHPQARVTIAGNPVQLQPDGTFRYHFKFPDHDYEIPIIATSPDGVETRSATLFFRRETAREGEVGATAQPAHLNEPMGRR
jgi:Domain of unknown function (DUF4912)